MFIHFSLSTFDGLEQTPGSTTPASVYNPSNLDVDQWIRVAKEAGMKYAVLTAKHSSGFCLSGQEITTLVNEYKAAGEHEIRWQPNGLPSGVYFYRLQVGDPLASSEQGFSEKKLIFQVNNY